MKSRPNALAQYLPLLVLPAVILWALGPLVVHAWDHVVDTRALYRELWPTIEPDVWLQIWILSWGAHVLPIDPWSLYQANAFHPTASALARSDHLLGILPIYAPAYYFSEQSGFRVPSFDGRELRARAATASMRCCVTRAAAGR